MDSPGKIGVSLKDQQFKTPIKGDEDLVDREQRMLDMINKV